MAVEVNDMTEAHAAWALMKVAAEMLDDLGGDYRDVADEITEAQNNLRETINEQS